MTEVWQAPRVRATVGYKKNMGAGTYESLSLEYSVEDNVRRKEDGSFEKVSDAFDRVADFVEGQLLDRLAEVVKEANTVVTTGNRSK
jgi:hypothetical protein